MPRLRLVLLVALLALVTALAAVAVPRRAHHSHARPKVRLAVLVVFDQMRGDFVEKWRPYFGDDGFRRMQDDGAWFVECHYPYATTVTGAGHASMLTGTSPNRHGIIGNDWYDRGEGGVVYCAGSDRYDSVPLPKLEPAAKADDKKDAGEAKPTRKSVGNPKRLLSPTLGDELKAATNGRGKVFGISLKDRSAILPVGQKPDGAYWFNGQFVTSTYYRETLPAWVDGFNRSGVASRWFGIPWTPLRPDLDYAAIAGPDDAKGEGTGRGQGVRFPHPTDGGKKTLGKEYYEALANSPYGNDLLLEFAKACIEAEKLGRDDVPDLLTISFSSNDLIGHTWGPDSQEVFDATLRSDRTLAELLRFLDARVGKGRYAVALTADHGVSPTPEAAARHGWDAKRVAASSFGPALEKYLQEHFGKIVGKNGKPPVGAAGKWVEAVSFPWVYLNQRNLAAKGINADEASLIVADWLRTHPDVQEAYRSIDLETLAKTDPVAAKVQASYYPGRAGDVYIVVKPYRLISDPIQGTGTSHGTPHRYDTHVPLLVYGPDLTGGVRDEPVTPQSAAAILASYLGVKPPRDASYPVPATLFDE